MNDREWREWKKDELGITDEQLDACIRDAKGSWLQIISAVSILVLVLVWVFH